jgi:hypothetical protein
MPESMTAQRMPRQVSPKRRAAASAFVANLDCRTAPRDGERRLDYLFSRRPRTLRGSRRFVPLPFPGDPPYDPEQPDEVSREITLVQRMDPLHAALRDRVSLDELLLLAADGRADRLRRRRRRRGDVRGAPEQLLPPVGERQRVAHELLEAEPADDVGVVPCELDFVRGAVEPAQEGLSQRGSGDAAIRPEQQVDGVRRPTARGIRQGGRPVVPDERLDGVLVRSLAERVGEPDGRHDRGVLRQALVGTAPKEPLPELRFVQ